MDRTLLFLYSIIFEGQFYFAKCRYFSAHAHVYIAVGIFSYRQSFVVDVLHVIQRYYEVVSEIEDL